jgi:sugar phosphate isomerase/epimerase
MPVCLEIFDHKIDKRSLIGPSPLAKRYVEAVASEVDNFGLMVDCSHIPMLGETIDEAIDPIADHIVHAHMGNTLIADPAHPVYGDNHPRFGYPGSENDSGYLAKFLRKLLAIGYLDRKRRNVLSFEIKPQGDEDPLLVIANAKRTLRDAWRLV